MSEEEKSTKIEEVDEVEMRKNMGDKRFHSETSLQHMGEENDYVDGDKDPGVRTSLNPIF